MLTVIDQNSLVHKYNFGSLITKQDDLAACEIVRGIIADGHWFIYPSNTWHRPGIVQSNRYRFILAVDVEYS
jgi:hypothetical protein